MRVYKITNKFNGLSYVGKTTRSIKQRWNAHVNAKKPYCRLLSQAIKEFGRDGFEIVELGTSKTLGELKELEVFFIKSENTIHPNGYNLQAGDIDRKHHAETKARMSLTRTGKKVPALQVPRGPMPLAARLNVSRAKKGRPNGLLGSKRAFKACPKRYVPVFATNEERSIAFSSIVAASRFLNKSHSNIVACLKGRKPSAYGFTWTYLTNNKGNDNE